MSARVEAVDAERRPLGHIILIVLALVVVWTIIPVDLARQYFWTRDAAVQVTNNLAHAFAENTIRTVEVVDQALLFVRNDYEREGAGFDLHAWSRSHTLLNGLQVQITIIDRTGAVRFSTLGSMAEGRVTDREHFRVQAASTTDDLYISTPVIGRISHRLSIQFVRKLIARDGSFDGIVVISLDPHFLARFYETISIGQGVIVLTNLDGVILARAPDRTGVVGRSLTPLAQAALRRPESSGTFVAPSEIDHVTRLFSYRRLDDYALSLNVGLADVDVFRQFRLMAALNIGIGLVLSAAILGAGRLMISQRRRLLASRRALGVTLENMTQGIMMVSPNGIVPVINSRAVELLGLPPDLMASRPTFRAILDWQLDNDEFGAPADRHPRLAAALDAGGIIDDDDVYERTRANGLVLEVRTKPMAGGGAVRTYTDVTERRKAEAALATARDLAEAGGRARTEFLAVMSHEIRTPMNSIIGFASLLLDMPMAQPALQYIRIIRQSGDHLLQLVNDILDMSKMDSGRLQLEEIAFDLHQEVTGAIALLIAQAQDKHLTLEVSIDAAVPRWVYGDPGRLRQILINLIGNAIKFTAAGGVVVSLAERSADPAPPHLLCSVSDSGIGIPADKIPLLFSQFTQADASVSRHYGGTGLGLAICKRLLEQMGGTIGVDSELGRGSDFHFALPLRVANAPLEAAEAPRLDHGNLRYRILLADDNDGNRVVITRMLEKYGHRVDTAGNGLEAVEAVRTLAYDLVVMDIMMPEMDGFAATAAIRGLPERSGRIPVIGLTANAAGSDEIGFGAGLSAFLTKPVTAERLVHTIVEVMEKHPAPASG